MTSCLEFRSQFRPGAEDPALLEHLRGCDACLDFAAHADPDVMFRAIGGGELTPPEGLDAFVADVMHAVQLRTVEGTMEKRPLSWPRRFAIAAALGIGVTGATLMYQVDRTPHAAVQTAVVAPRPKISVQGATNSSVETYSSPDATIVDVPNENAGDAKIVMVIDDSLPADL